MKKPIDYGKYTCKQLLEMITDDQIKRGIVHERNRSYIITKQLHGTFRTSKSTLMTIAASMGL